MYPTFIQYLTEDFKPKLSAKPEKVKDTYVKTNDKRVIDEYNDKVGKWHDEHKKDGATIYRRKVDGHKGEVLDAVKDKKIVSTMEVTHGTRKNRKTGDEETDHNSSTFNTYNHGAGKNKYSADPKDVNHTAHTFRKKEGGGLHKDDTRNKKNSDQSMKTNRRRDGEERHKKPLQGKGLTSLAGRKK